MKTPHFIKEPDTFYSDLRSEIEIYFRKNDYENAIDALMKSKEYKFKSNNLNIILRNSNLFAAEDTKTIKTISDKNKYYSEALRNYKITLQNDPNNYFCLKNCAHFYGLQGNYLKALETLDNLLENNQDDSLILCHYGEILNYIMNQ